MIKLSRSKNTSRGGMPIEKDIECPEITTLSGHSGPVESVAFHPTNPNLMATGSDDKTAMLWHVSPDGSASIHVTTLKKYTGNVMSVAFHPTIPNLLATGGSRGGRGVLMLWQVNADGSAVQTPAGTLIEHKNIIYSLAFHPTIPNLLATGSLDGYVNLCHFQPDGSRATLVSILEVNINGVFSVAFHPTLPLLATGSGDKTAKLWRVEPDGSSATLIATLEGHSGSVYSVAFHPTIPNLLATCSTDGTAKFWHFQADGSRPICAITLNRHSECVFSVVFHPTLPLLATCCSDNTAKLWLFRPDGSAAILISSLRGHSDSVTCVAFHPTIPYLLATGSRDNTVKLWDISKVLEYLLNQRRKIVITQDGLTSRLIKAFTTTQTTFNIPRIKLSNEVQGRVGNPPDFPYQSDNNAKQSKIKSIKYLEFPRTALHVPNERLTSKIVDSSVSSPSFVQLQPSEVLTSSSSALSDAETPSVSSFCRVDDTSCEALYQSIPWTQLQTIPGSCSDAADILKKLKQLKELLISQEKPTGLTDRWIKLLQQKISSCKP